MDPEAELQLGFGAPGRISTVLVKPGDYVRTGTSLARQEDEIERIRRDLLLARLVSKHDIEAREARIALMLSKLERARTLAERDVGSAAQLEELVYEHELAKIGLQQALTDQQVREKELALAEAELERKTLTSPVDGLILEISRKQGEYAERNDPVLKLGVLDPLRIRAFPDVAFYGKLSSDDLVKVRPYAPFEGDLEAKIIHVSPLVDPASRTFLIEAQLPNPGNRLPAGHRCLIDF
jgi:RND family efflux transporter MFP subunit